MEGEYDEIMKVVKAAQEVCLNTGAESLISNLKIEWHKGKDASMNEKTEKYT